MYYNIYTKTEHTYLPSSWKLQDGRWLCGLDKADLKTIHKAGFRQLIDDVPLIPKYHNAIFKDFVLIKNKAYKYYSVDAMSLSEAKEVKRQEIEQEILNKERMPISIGNGGIVFPNHETVFYLSSFITILSIKKDGSYFFICKNGVSVLLNKEELEKICNKIIDPYLEIQNFKISMESKIEQCKTIEEIIALDASLIEISFVKSA